VPPSWPNPCERLCGYGVTLGLGSQDLTAIAQLYERWAGVEILHRQPSDASGHAGRARGVHVRVFALKYAERDTTACHSSTARRLHDTLTLHYFVWLILGAPSRPRGHGCLDDDPRARGMRDYVSPAEMVERAGVKPAEVPSRLITHLHYDHWGGHSLFPPPSTGFQRDEVAF